MYIRERENVLGTKPIDQGGNPMSVVNLNEAIKLIEKNENEHAQYILVKIIKNDLQNETAWYWYLKTLITEYELIQGLEIFYMHNPNGKISRDDFTLSIPWENIKTTGKGEMGGQLLGIPDSIAAGPDSLGIMHSVSEQEYLYNTSGSYHLFYTWPLIPIRDKHGIFTPAEGYLGGYYDTQSNSFYRFPLKFSLHFKGKTYVEEQWWITDYYKTIEAPLVSTYGGFPNHVFYRGAWFIYDNNLMSPDIKMILDEAFQKLDRRRDIAQLDTTQEEHQTKRKPLPDDVQIFVWNRDSGRCVNCGSQENLEFDHIIPVSKGGSNTARNVQLLCESCNREKGNRIGG